MRRADERGLATVVGVALTGLLLIVAIAATYAVAAVAAHRRAQVAADLAAVAGASALQDGDQGCDRAAELAARNDGRLTACQVTEWTVEITVAVRLRLPLVGSVDLPARARAGPAQTVTQSLAQTLAQSFVSR